MTEEEQKEIAELKKENVVLKKKSDRPDCWKYCELISTITEK